LFVALVILFFKNSTTTTWRVCLFRFFGQIEER
jgi:hypothetical protein